MSLLTKFWARMARRLKAIAPDTVSLPLACQEQQGLQPAMQERAPQAALHLMRGADAWILPQKKSDRW